MLKQIVVNYELSVPFEGLDRDIGFVYEALLEQVAREVAELRKNTIGRAA